MDKIIQKAIQKHLTEAEKHKIIQELISTQCTKVEIWENILVKKKSMGSCFAGCGN